MRREKWKRLREEGRRERLVSKGELAVSKTTLDSTFLDTSFGPRGGSRIMTQRIADSPDSGRFCLPG